MYSVIYQLYNGQIVPKRSIPDHQMLCGELKQYLSPELADKFSGAMSAENGEMFHYGFCLGVRMMMEVMQCPDFL